MQKKDKKLQTKMSEEEYLEIQQAAEKNNETVSGYSRRILLESARTPISTQKDVTGILMNISFDMQALQYDNTEKMISRINEKGRLLCQTLYSRQGTMTMKM